MCRITPTTKLNSFAMRISLDMPVYTELPVAKEPPAPLPTGKKSKIKKKATPEFKFSLKYRGEEVEGMGKTKQDAKHSAAEAMVDKLKIKFPKELAKEDTTNEEDELYRMVEEKGLSVSWEYVKEEVIGTGRRRFTVRCAVSRDRLCVEGKGEDKKAARLDAARKILSQEDIRPATPPPPRPRKGPGKKNKGKSADESESEECLEPIVRPASPPPHPPRQFEDAISVLQEYLMQNNLNLPNYSAVQDDVTGYFTVTCKLCSATDSAVEFTTSGKKKQETKHYAADGVLNILGVTEKPQKKKKQKGNKLLQTSPVLPYKSEPTGDQEVKQYYEIF